jgi:hypothetical protein
MDDAGVTVDDKALSIVFHSTGIIHPLQRNTCCKQSSQYDTSTVNDCHAIKQVNRNLPRKCIELQKLKHRCLTTNDRNRFGRLDNVKTALHRPCYATNKRVLKNCASGSFNIMAR